MDKELDLIKKVTQLYKEHKYNEIVEVLKEKRRTDEKEYYDCLSNYSVHVVENGEEIPITTFFQITEDEETLPIEKSNVWLFEWSRISPSIAHQKFYGEIYPSLRDTDEIMSSIYTYRYSIFPKIFINSSEKLKVTEKFEKMVSEQVLDMNERTKLFRYIIKCYNSLDEYGHAVSLLSKNIDYFKSAEIWGELYTIAHNTESKNILIQAIAATNSYINKIDNKKGQLQDIKERINRFLNDAFIALKNDIKKLEEQENLYSEGLSGFEEETSNFFKQHKLNKKKFVVEYEEVLDSDNVDKLIETVFELAYRDILEGNLYERGVKLRSLIDNYTDPIQDSEQLKTVNRNLEGKLLSIYIKDIKHYYRQQLENLDEETPEYMSLMKDLVSEINSKVQKEYERYIEQGQQETEQLIKNNHLIINIQEATSYIYQLFEQDGINVFLSNDEILKNQLIMGELTYRNSNEFNNLIKENRELEISNIDYSAAAIPFTVALEHTLEKYFIVKFKEYCDQMGEVVPKNVERILNPNSKMYFSLGGFTYLLADPNYKRIADKYFRNMFHNQYVIADYPISGNVVGHGFSFVKQVTEVSRLRNKVAHKDIVSKSEADNIRTSIIGLSQGNMQNYQNPTFKILINLLKDIKL
ncbi:hypothetical protein CN675_21870 [Bacillus toyonensis]|uniref:hypothetical protein n=1 Tax=Bacillus toyonensis TaxID=155322 RepID=UPI000BF1DC5D|nr:hypothetical protein [Bacillus toyonensis]PEJ14311.1 hypothetical protein CN675_21870 [Bacillus toyonensis]